MERGSEPRRKARVLVVVLAVLALWPGGAAAQTGEIEPPIADERTAGEEETRAAEGSGLRRSGERPWRREAAASGERESFGRKYLRTLGWLVVIVLVAGGAIVALRRMSPGSFHPQNRRLVQVIGRGALGPKHQVVVTRVGERILILGLTSDRIVRLGEVDDPREAVKLLPPEQSFAGSVTLSEAAYREEDAAQGDIETSLEPYRREIDRLRGMVELWQRERAEPERGTA
jgi:flagellar biogenesis protein FliO